MVIFNVFVIKNKISLYHRLTQYLLYIVPKMKKENIHFIANHQNVLNYLTNIINDNNNIKQKAPIKPNSSHIIENMKSV